MNKIVVFTVYAKSVQFVYRDTHPANKFTDEMLKTYLNEQFPTSRDFSFPPEELQDLPTYYHDGTNLLISKGFKDEVYMTDIFVKEYLLKEATC